MTYEIVCTSVRYEEHVLVELYDYPGSAWTRYVRTVACGTFEACEAAKRLMESA